jgi:tetratricopeptide (TPR) repeat protein
MRSIAVLGLVSALQLSLWGQVSPAPAKSADTADKNTYAAESVVSEQQSSVYRYAPDGTGSREVTAVLRMQSDAAAQQFSVLDFPFAGSNEHVEIDYVRVRKPDGTLVETPASDAQEMPTEVTRQAPFYSDLKEVQIPIRSLRNGDKLEYKARIVRTRPEVPNHFWGQETFGTGLVILNETIELRVPKDKYVKVWCPDHAAAVTNEGNETVYRWKGSQLEPTVKPDGKANTHEVDPDGELPAIAWTTFKSWDEVGSWYRSLETDRVVPNAEIKAKVAELTAGKTTDEDKVRALYSYVATQVRYIGVAFGIGRYQPHPASEILGNQYGDCKDKHTLLAAMLTAAGFHPSAVLIGADVRLNPDVPSPGTFNHLITTVPVDGQQIWLDTTSEVAPYRMLLADIRDKQALVIPETGPAKLERTPADPPFPSTSRFTATGTLNKEGTVDAQIDYTTRGDDEFVIRALLRQVPPGQWDQFTQRLSQNLGFGGTTSHAHASRPDLTTDPETLSYDYQREKLGDWDNYRIIPLFPAVFLPTIDDKNPPQKYPINLGEPRTETSVSTLKLPEGWSAELPDAIHEKTAFATFDKTYKLDHGTLTVERRVQILEKKIPADDWKSYKKWLDATVSSDEPYIQLTAAGAKPADKDSVLGASFPEAIKLLQSAASALQRRDLDEATRLLDQVKAADPNQRGLWAMYGYLNALRPDLAASIDSYQKELTLHPDEIDTYRALAQMQFNLGRKQDAEETLHKLVAAKPDDASAAVWLANTLIADGQSNEARKVLEAVSEKIPDDKQEPSLRIALATAELESGEKLKGEAILKSALKDSEDPETLNDAAYELANSSLDMDLAENSARRAIDILSTETKSWQLGDTGKKEKQRTTLLVASWDTLGWILFREGKTDEAEGYVRAAWLSYPLADVGLHLGQIEEARGKKQEAIDVYDMAKVSQLGSNLMGGNTISKPTQTELNQREELLWKKGLRPSFRDGTFELQKQRQLSLGKAEGRKGYETYNLFIVDSKVSAAQVSTDSKDSSEIKDGLKLVESALFSRWTPPGSTAQIPRQATLNCHGDICELVVFPM